MISRPTTDQVLDDCARELRETLLPVVADATLRVRVEMLEQVLKACAVRAAHEIAWMAEEATAMVAFAGEVAAAYPEEHRLPALVRACEDARNSTETRLDLENQVRLYDLAGEALSAAIAVSFAVGDSLLAAKGGALVRDRSAHEAELRLGFRFPGRT